MLHAVCVRGRMGSYQGLVRLLFQSSNFFAQRQGAVPCAVQYTRWIAVPRTKSSAMMRRSGPLGHEKS